MKLIFGTLKRNEIQSDIDVLNLSSFNEEIEKVELIPPPRFLTQFYNSNTEKELDIEYANAILQNNELFLEFMKIVFHIYEGKDLYIMISEKFTVYNDITDSLEKLISSRYGLVVSHANTKEDLDCVEDYELSVLGLKNIDDDMNRFAKLYVEKYGEASYQKLVNEGY